MLELLYVCHGTIGYPELRSPVVRPDGDHDDDDDSDANERRGHWRHEDAEQEVPLRELQQRFQPQGWPHLSSDIRVRSVAAIQVPVLRLLCPAQLERASTRAEMPSRSGGAHDRPVQVAATRPLRPGVYSEDRRRPRRTTIRGDQRRRAILRNGTPDIVRRSFSCRSAAARKNGTWGIVSFRPH
ncbi:uncharacterized protein LOC118646604 isoform X2 [Monomorium pharaonis]|uniref:uncharacterized protein LOC118646604 isoform X2 n=1 Tax=Monomorium pharaonis TaxID=307658 RepID=UPI001747741F|nr:uncharacterized protein LOC118646604 isoform X2 [Monomorium pharaonis]